MIEPYIPIQERLLMLSIFSQIHDSFLYHINHGTGYFTIPKFDETGLVHHCFSTRQGGYSHGECSTLNLGLKRNDDKNNVTRNFQKICECIDVDFKHLVLSDQIHQNKVYPVTEKDQGKGIYQLSDIIGVDSLITDTHGIPLATFYADCVPIFFLDPIHRAIGTAHAGWRGIIQDIAKETLMQMNIEFGTRPNECLVGIGPSIGVCCFEVGSDVADVFTQTFTQKGIVLQANDGKHSIDLWKACIMQLLNAGIIAKNITVSNLCTKCNSELFFSHRREHGHTGSLAAIIQLI